MCSINNYDIDIPCVPYLWLHVYIGINKSKSPKILNQIISKTWRARIKRIADVESAQKVTLENFIFVSDEKKSLFCWAVIIIYKKRHQHFRKNITRLHPAHKIMPAHVPDAYAPDACAPDAYAPDAHAPDA